MSAVVYMPEEPDIPCLLFNLDLEEHLDGIFRRRLALPFHNTEVEFVKNVIEKFVSEIVDVLIRDKEQLFHFIGDVNIRQNVTANTGPNLYKAGSFYERTKNTYPDEFDFVYAPYSLHLAPSIQNSFLEIKVIELRRTIECLANSGKLTHMDSKYGEISYDGYKGQHGPASTLNFLFSRNTRNLKDYQQAEKVIGVDLVPAIRVYDPELARNVSNVCPIPGFRELITEAGAYFWIPFSFTAFNETEVHFMRHVLSRKHVKAYRLLKYIINGDGDGDDLKKECENSKHHIKCFIPSYAIKTGMIIHHFQCQDDSDNTGHCVIEILKWFLKKFKLMRQKSKDNYQSYHVDITAPSNKIITLATGKEDLIQDAKKSLENLIEYLQQYRKKRHGHDSDITSFSARMQLCVANYVEEHGPCYRRYSYVLCSRFGVTVTGKACYNFVIVLTLFALVIVLFFAFIPRKDKM